MSNAVKSQIEKQSKLWEECYRTQQWKALANLYTEDCKVYPPGRPIAVGRGECAAAWKGLGDSGVARIALRLVEAEYEAGDMAADRSTFTMYDKSGREINNGEYVVIWRRVQTKGDSQWQLHYDIFNAHKPSVKDVHAVVIEQSAKWQHFYAIGDFESLSHLYTPDCKVFAPGSLLSEGRIACSRSWARLRAAGARLIKFESVETIEMGDGMASDHTNYKITDSRGKQIDHGKYVVIWKRLEDGQWYLHFDIFNSDVN